jgi:hypothetical protein
VSFYANIKIKTLKHIYVRFQHCETNFREERGIKNLQKSIVSLGLPAVAFLDYAWLQTNYYKEKPQGYGMNWFPIKAQGGSTWNQGKIKMLFSVRESYICTFFHFYFYQFFSTDLFCQPLHIYMQLHICC